MAGSTDHYGLSTLGSGDSISDDDFKYANADRHTIDRKLWLGAEGHHHIGGVGDSVLEPDSAPTLTLSNTGGTLPPGTRVYYKYTYVNERGEESIGSPESFVDTPTAVASPGAATLTYANTGGSLPGGNYYYVLSAYQTSTIAETKAINPSYITVPVTATTNVITLALPSLPTGATGFNIYRRAPGQAKFFFLASVNMNVATPPTTYVDNGSVEEDCDRTIPTTNTTNTTSSIIITHPGATPTVPVGYTWKIYRTYVTGAWTTTLLHHVVEYTSETSGIITPTYTDVGASTFTGSPPTSSSVAGNPSKIEFDDAAEVQGELPPGRVSAFPTHQVFAFAGPLQTGFGEMLWPCPYDEAEVLGAIVSLGDGSTPASTPVIVDVLIGRGATPSFSSVYLVDADHPRVLPTLRVGSYATATETQANRRMAQGDTLAVDIEQTGGGATPTDEDATIVVFMQVDFGDLNVTEVWT